MSKNIEQHPAVRYTKQIIPKETWHKARAAAILANKTLAQWLTEVIEKAVEKDK